MEQVKRVKTIIGNSNTELDQHLAVYLADGWNLYGNIVVGRYGELFQQVVRYRDNSGFTGPM